MTGGWRKQRSEQLHKLYSTANIKMLIKPKEVRSAGYVALMLETKNRKKLGGA
jgi:hypothetical protein